MFQKNEEKCDGMDTLFHNFETLFTLCFPDDQLMMALDQDDAKALGWRMSSRSKTAPSMST